MIGFIVKVLVVVVVAVLAYNYFFGTVEEQAQSAKVFAQMKEVAVSVGQLARSEKEKFDAGKYDAALDKLAGVYRTAREGAKRLDAGLQKRIGDLEKREGELRAEIEEIDAAEKTADKGPDAGRKRAEQTKRKEKLHKEMEQLIRDSESLLKDVDRG